MLKKGERSCLYIGARSWAVDLSVLGLLVHLNKNILSVYDWAVEELQEYPRVVQDMEGWIFYLFDVSIKTFMYVAAVFLLSDMLMLSGIVMSNVHGKWLILPWISLNIVYSILMCSSPVILVSIFWPYYYNLTYYICALTILAISFNNFIVNWHSIDVVLKHFMDKSLD